MKRPILPILLCSMSLLACSQYDTDVTGEKFEPFSGIVGPYTHQVYVEFHDHNVNVWGPAANEISYRKEGARVTIDCLRDSMSFFCFGTALNDSLHDGDGQLHIVSDHSFAVYLNSLRLTSLSGPAIWLDTDETTHVVVSGKAANVLTDRKQQIMQDSEGFELMGNPDACFMTRGAVTFNGTGSLRIRSEAPVFVDDNGENHYPHALHAMGGLRCAFAIKMDLWSRYGDAIHVDADDVAIGEGTWALHSGRHGIANEEGSILLSGGKVSGSSLDAFVSVANDQLFTVRDASCIAVAGARSQFMEDLSQAHLDSTQIILQSAIEDFQLQSDTTYIINHKDTAQKSTYKLVGNITPRFDIAHPHLLLSTSALSPVDSLQIKKK